MDSVDSRLDCRIDVGSGHVVVVVGMKVELQLRISAGHAAYELVGLLRIEDP